MGTVPFDCPHARCLTKNVGLRLVASYSRDGEAGCTFGHCPVCHEGVVLFIRWRNKAQVSRAHELSGGEFQAAFDIVDYAPRPPEREVVNNLPNKVARVFDEAEANFADGRHMSAATMYRKSIELTLKHLNPGQEGSLSKRIRSLQSKEAVPDTLIKLLDSVRFLGNDGAHDEDPPPPEDVERGRDFTRLFLVYSYELPARVDAALARNAPTKED